MEEKNLGTTQRLGKNFTKELEEIITRRGNLRKVSIEKITDLLVKHKSWQKIKEEIIEYEFSNLQKK